MKKIEKNKEYNTLSFSIPEQAKYLIKQIKGKETYTSFILKSIDEMFYKLNKYITLPGNKLKPMSITRPSEEIVEKMNYYITESRVFTSRGALITFSILCKILNEIEYEEEKEEIEEEIEEETMEEYLKRKKLRIIGEA